MSSERETFIERGRKASSYWRDLWERRDLIFHMAWRDISVRYKQTYLGLAWALIQPFIAIVVFTIVFHKVAKLDSVEDAPYAVMVFSALIPWQLFASSLTGISSSMVGSGHLVQRVYFPRMVIPAKAIVVAGWNTMISLGLLVVVMAAYGHAPGWQVIFLPLFFLMAALSAFALGAWVAVLNVRYRDFRYLVPYMVQMGMYISPVGFKSTIVDPEWQMLYTLNPMVGAIDGCRWALLGGPAPWRFPTFWASIALIILLAAGGIWFFRRHEGTFADRI